jgi:hypothetical protein
MQKQVTPRTAQPREGIRKPLAEGIMKRRPHSFFTKMSDNEFVAFAKKVVEEKGIKNRSGLRIEDQGLYYALWKRKLLDEVEFEKSYRDWGAMSDEELVAFAKKVVEEKRIKSRNGLKKEDSGLYQALRKRKLLDKIGFETIRRDWESMSGKELVALGKKLVAKEGITSRNGLKREDAGLYKVLQKRNFLDKIEFESKRKKKRNWTPLSDKELVLVAKEFVAKKGIKNRSGLENDDSGLYQALLKRKLLDAVFSDLEKFKEREAVREVCNALSEFN